MRLIDVDVLMAKIDAWDEAARNGTNPNCKNGNEYEAAMDICIMVEESPTIDAVPVVRCKECISSEKITLDNGHEMCYCVQLRGNFDLNHFCSWGEHDEGVNAGQRRREVRNALD